MKKYKNDTRIVKFELSFTNAITVLDRMHSSVSWTTFDKASDAIAQSFFPASIDTDLADQYIQEYIHHFNDVELESARNCTVGIFDDPYKPYGECSERVLRNIEIRTPEELYNFILEYAHFE